GACARAALPRPRPPPPRALHAGGPLVCRLAAVGLGNGRGARRGPRAAGGAGGLDAGASADRREGVGRGGVAGGVPRAAGGWHVEARLPALQRGAEPSPARVRPRVQGPTPGRGVPEAGPGGGRPRRTPEAGPGRRGPSSSAVVAGDPVS